MIKNEISYFGQISVDVAFPSNEDPPAVRFKALVDGRVPLNIPTKSFSPLNDVCARHPCRAAVKMAVPIAAVHENNYAKVLDHDVRRSGKPLFLSSKVDTAFAERVLQEPFSVAHLSGRIPLSDDKADSPAAKPKIGGTASPIHLARCVRFGSGPVGPKNLNESGNP